MLKKKSGNALPKGKSSSVLLKKRTGSALMKVKSSRSSRNGAAETNTKAVAEPKGEEPQTKTMAEDEKPQEEDKKPQDTRDDVPASPEEQVDQPKATEATASALAPTPVKRADPVRVTEVAEARDPSEDEEVFNEAFQSLCLAWFMGDPEGLCGSTKDLSSNDDASYIEDRDKRDKKIKSRGKNKNTMNIFGKYQLVMSKSKGF
ncbi:hypothetical protein ACHAWF_000893 [Thalassiosira exigua]